MPSFTWKENTDSHFKHTRLSVEEPVGRVERRFAVATGCSARLSWHFRADAGAKVAACGQAGGGQARARPASRKGKRRRWWLTDEALVEFVGRGARERSGMTVSSDLGTDLDGPVLAEVV